MPAPPSDPRPPDPGPPTQAARPIDGPPAAPNAAPAGSAWQVFWVFLRLGLGSFGGPVAHLGYFRTELVQRRRWLDEAHYAELVALCQFLPGPASSQVGIAIGLLRAGWAGSLAAWLGFTLPSALLMTVLGLGLAGHGALAQSGWVHGLKLAAVAVVAQAVWGMGRSLCPDRPRAGLALGAALLALAWPGAAGQLLAIAACALAGFFGRAGPAASAVAPSQALPDGGISRRAGAVALGLLTLALLALPLAAHLSGSPLLTLVDGVFRAGALVFGGGHVVLPLLQSVLVPPGWIGAGDFLAGYGAAQAMPGPLFSIGAYLGAALQGPVSGVAGALLVLLSLFAPAYLLVVGAWPFWQLLRRHPRAGAALAGVNAGVVGLLLAALYDPVWTGAVHSRADFALALAAFGLLLWGRWPPLAVVAGTAAAGGLLALL